MGIEFDTTINIGHLLTLAAGLVAVILFWFSMVRRLDKIEFRLNLIWGWFRARTSPKQED